LEPPPEVWALLSTRIVDGTPDADSLFERLLRSGLAEGKARAVPFPRRSSSRLIPQGGGLLLAPPCIGAIVPRNSCPWQKRKHKEGDEDATTEDSAEVERVLMSPPEGLTLEQASAMPNRAEVEARIRRIDGDELMQQMKVRGLSPETWAAIEDIKNPDINLPEIEEALARCNKARAAVAKAARGRFIQPVQQHGVGKTAAVLHLINGSWPTVTCMNDRGTLTTEDNATVMALSLLEGCTLLRVECVP